MISMPPAELEYRHEQVDAVVGAELAIDRLEVKAHGLRRDAEAPGDGGVLLAVDDAADDFALAGGQAVGGAEVGDAGGPMGSEQSGFRTGETPAIAVGRGTELPAVAVRVIGHEAAAAESLRTPTERARRPTTK